MKPGSEILVSCADRIVWVRVEGNGSSTNSTALKDFAKEMIHRGAREFIVDLCNCPVMDSTFMGTLAGISLWLGELCEGCLSVVNLNERNAESLCSLGRNVEFRCLQDGFLDQVHEHLGILVIDSVDMAR